MKTPDRHGFTVVELLVVLIVVGIVLAASVGVYLNWRQQTAETEVKNDLTAAASAMKNARNFGGDKGYPTDVNTVFRRSAQVNLSSTTDANHRTFCLVASSTRVSSVSYVLSDTMSEPRPGGSCT